MARIPYFDPAASPWPSLLETLPKLNIFNMMGHMGPTAEGFSRFGLQLLYETKLDAVLREIAIIRVGVLSKASYEVHQHERIGRREGLSDEIIAAIHEGPQAASFSDLQRKVMAYTDDVVMNVRASDATFEPLRAELSVQELQELTMCIGFYMMVSRFLETFGVDIEEEPAAA